ncbi:MAG: hypothetical protein ABGX27_02515 [Desulfurobacteriaceae bacterium]
MKSGDAKERLQELMEKMKKKEIEPIDFFKGMVKILEEVEIKNSDLEGATPLLLNFVNRVLQNMEKRGS